MAQPSVELAAVFTPVLDWLDRGGDDDLGYNLSSFVERTPCGTTCCIGGAVGLFNELNYEGCPSDEGYDQFLYRANFADMALKQNYGMTAQDADQLFFGGLRMLRTFSSQEAATVVRHWLQTGEVDWTLPTLA